MVDDSIKDIVENDEDLVNNALKEQIDSSIENQPKISAEKIQQVKEYRENMQDESFSECWKKDMVNNDESKKVFEHSNGNMRKVIIAQKQRELGVFNAFKSDFMRACCPRRRDPYCRGHDYAVPNDVSEIKPEDLNSVQMLLRVKAKKLGKPIDVRPNKQEPIEKEYCEKY